MQGYLNDDYSIDEYNGYLRILTTYTDNGGSANALYILDDKLRGVSVLKRIAEGETIKSARFMGDTAYFVTYRNTDPLFAVDLTDETDPRIIGYLKIPGFSAYLHPFGDGLLLGIGYDTDYIDRYGRTLWYDPVKLTVFDVSDPADIKEVYTETLEAVYSASVLENRNAFFCDPEKKLFGFSAMADTNRSEYEAYYMLFSFDEYQEFIPEIQRKLGESEYQMKDARGVSIGDYFYIMNPSDEHASYSLKDYKLISEVY